MSESILELLREKFTLEVFEREDGHVKHGRLISEDSRDWHKIENFIWDLLPSGLKDQSAYAIFSQRWSLSVTKPVLVADPKKYEEQVSQIEFFKEDSKVYDRDVSGLTFYQISDQLTFHTWMNRFAPGALILDIGGGTGRQAIPFAEKDLRTVSIDISQEMLAVAVSKARAKGLLGKIYFVLCDATVLPFKPEIFDGAIAYGTLHHVPSPADTVAEVSRVLKKNGSWFSYDPNESPLRFVFELAMKIKQLYVEEAAHDHHMKEVELTSWCKKAGIDHRIKYHFYILPHFINLIGFRFGKILLVITDAIFSKIPGFRRVGGIIICEGTKQ